MELSHELRKKLQEANQKYADPIVLAANAARRAEILAQIDAAEAELAELNAAARRVEILAQLNAAVDDFAKHHR